jgi:hypothetical protein
MDWRRWAGQIVNLIDFDMQWESNIVPNDLEVLVVKQMFNISMGAGKKVVDTHNDGTLGEQALA